MNIKRVVFQMHHFIVIVVYTLRHTERHEEPEPGSKVKCAPRSTRWFHLASDLYLESSVGPGPIAAEKVCHLSLMRENGGRKTPHGMLRGGGGGGAGGLTQKWRS